MSKERFELIRERHKALRAAGKLKGRRRQLVEEEHEDAFDHIDEDADVYDEVERERDEWD